MMGYYQFVIRGDNAISGKHIFANKSITQEWYIGKS